MIESLRSQEEQDDPHLVTRRHVFVGAPCENFVSRLDLHTSLQDWGQDEDVGSHGWHEGLTQPG